MTDSIDQPDIDRFLANPDRTREHIGVVSQALPAPLADPGDELVMDARLQVLQPLDILFILGLERIPHGLGLAGRMDAPLDPQLCNRLVKPESGGNHPDGSQDRGLVRVDLVCSTRQPVPARRRNVGTERVDRHLLFVGQPSDPRTDHRALRRRAARTIDRQRHCIQPGQRERLGNQRRHRRIVECPPEAGFKMTAAQLDAAITERTKWLMFCSPGNPTGSVLGLDTLDELADVLLEHPHVHILSDDVYEHLVFDGRTFSTFAQIEPRLYDRTVTCNGVSKAYSMTGWRLGFAGGPKKIIANMSKMQSQSTSGVNAVAQGAAVAALHAPLDLVHERTANLQHRRDMLFDALSQIPELQCARPEGAMYIFCSCAGAIGKRTPDGKVIENDTDFVMYLLDSVGVAVVQGSAYGLAPYFRASFVATEPDLIRGGKLIREACAALI